MRRAVGVVLAGLLWAGPTASAAATDLEAARRLFETNLDAIRRRDAAAYRACYLESPNLVRSGPDGPTLGIESFVTPADDTWPEALHAYDLRLVPVRPGVVYGSYRYRVVFDGVPTEGLSERVFIDTPDGWRIAVSTAFPAPESTPAPPLALVGGTLIDGTGRPPLTDASVLLGKGRITCAGTRAACPVPPGTDVVDVRGRWLVPGLIDAHVHFSQTGWVDARPDAFDVRDRYPYEQAIAWLRDHVEVLYRSYLYNGVTAVFDLGGYPWTLALSGAAEGSALAPHVAAAGPLLTTFVPEIVTLPAQSQFVRLAEDEAIDRAVAAHAAFGADAIKVWFIVRPGETAAGFAPQVRRAGEAARRAGLPMIVHATQLETAKEALRAGARMLVHGVDDRPVDEEFLGLAKQAGVICTPTLTVLEGYAQVFERRWREAGVALEGVDPDTLRRARATADLPPDDQGLAPALRTRFDAQRRTSADNVRRMRDAGVRLAVGTDAGNPLTLHGASIFNEIEAMAAAGLTPMEALVAATANGALALGRTDLGTIEADRHADLLVLDADPLAAVANLRSIRAVVRRGTWHERQELRALPASR